MGIDLVVMSLGDEWASRSDDALRWLSSLDALVPFGEQPLPFDRALSARAFAEAPGGLPGQRRPAVDRAVRDFQERLSLRFDRAVAWTDRPSEETYLGQVAPRSVLAVHEWVTKKGRDRTPNFAVWDIHNMYLPVELPTVLVGQPWPLGSAPALRREVRWLRDELGAQDDVEYLLEKIEKACTDAIETERVLIVSG